MAATQERRAKGRRIGLSLAGGGHAGAIYEIGALWALQESLEGVDFARLSCYVGVSAGALVAASLANRMTPELLVRIVHDDAPHEEPLAADVFFTPNYRALAGLAFSVPRLLARALWRFAGRRHDPSLLAALTQVAEALPLGILDNDPIRRYLARTFARGGRTDDFRELETRLVVVAADLESGRPVRFGRPEHPRVAISRAVQASTAVPGVYAPVHVANRICVDGVLLKTLHASVALDDGVELLFCVNPLVPLDAILLAERRILPRGALMEHGLPAVMSQTFRTLVHSRLEVGLAGYAERYPDADIVLFEPGRDAHEMFFGNLFSLESRHEVCELAYQTTRRQLRERADTLEPILARHGVTIRHDILDDDSRTVRTGTESPDADAVRAPRAAAQRRIASSRGGRGRPASRQR